MTLLVIGYITRDTLIYPHQNWRIVEGIGGTYYTISALAALTNDKIVPVCNVGEDVYDQVIDSFRKYPNIEMTGIRRVRKSNLHCYIYFGSEYGTQYDEGHEVPITYRHTAPFLDGSNFILMSSMTGFDFNLRNLKKIKDEANCPIYFDYHVLALDRDELGNRFLRRRRNWLEWCSSCDHLQLNKFEAEQLSRFSIDSMQDMARFSEIILGKGVKSIAVTRGNKGAYVSWLDNNGSVIVNNIDPRTDMTFVDATGCGDIFAAGFMVKYIKTQDLSTSYIYANQTAGFKCNYGSVSDFADAIATQFQRP